MYYERVLLSIKSETLFHYDWRTLFFNNKTNFELGLDDRYYEIF